MTTISNLDRDGNPITVEVPDQYAGCYNPRVPNVGQIVKRFRWLRGWISKLVSDGSPVVETLVSLDFKNGIYSINGVSKTIGEVLTGDAAWAGAFNPATVVADFGLTSGGGANGPILTVEALAAIGSAGFTFTSSYVIGTTQPLFELGWVVLPGYANEIYIDFASNAGTPRIWNGAAATNWGSTPGAGSHKAAALVTLDACALSIDGNAPISTDPPSATVPNSIAFYVVGALDNAIEKVEFIAPGLAGDLPALSV